MHVAVILAPFITGTDGRRMFAYTVFSTFNDVERYVNFRILATNFNPNVNIIGPGGGQAS